MTGKIYPTLASLKCGFSFTLRVDKKILHNMIFSYYSTLCIFEFFRLAAPMRMGI